MLLRPEKKTIKAQVCGCFMKKMSRNKAGKARGRTKCGLDNTPSIDAPLHPPDTEGILEVFAWAEENDLEVKGKEAEEFLKKLENPDPELLERRREFLRTLDSD